MAAEGEEPPVCIAKAREAFTSIVLICDVFYAILALQVALIRNVGFDHHDMHVKVIPAVECVFFTLLSVFTWCQLAGVTGILEKLSSAIPAMNCLAYFFF